jgi:hypothetical protein
MFHRHQVMGAEMSDAWIQALEASHGGEVCRTSIHI